MKAAGRGRAMGSVIGPSVIAASVILAMTLVLFWSQTTALAGTTWLARMLAQQRNRTFLFTPPPFQNITCKLLDELARNGTAECHNHRTNSTKVIGLPENATLSTNTVHKFWLQSYTHDGAPRCAGGDYYELDLSSPLWKSRPPSTDLQNGTYAVELLVPDAFAGETFTFSAHLLFDAYHGLDHKGEHFHIGNLAASRTITFVATNSTPSSNLNRCNSARDFLLPEWRGRWTRPLANDSCAPDAKGRYAHCFNSSVPCRNPTWCSGNISRLESVGWSYSAHCAFHIFSQTEAWNCLAGRYLFFWGDSNHQDTIRNLLTLILGIPPPPGRDLAHASVDRAFQSWVRNPSNPDQELRITSHFNGHPEVDNNGLGLDSLDKDHEPYRNHIRNFFPRHHSPDTVIMNSGLHDGIRHKNLDAYIKSVEHALDFWQQVFANEMPQLVYRTTVAPAGASRGMGSNPHKMEVYNHVMVEKVKLRFPQVKVVDAFDMTFPFHYNNNFSDGGHYGRAPGAGNRGPHYFVDVMVAHVLLNAICNPKP